MESSKPITIKDLAIKCQNVALAIPWLLSLGLLHDFSGACPECEDGHIYLAPDKSVRDGFKWRCNRRHCRKTWSICMKTWFAKSHLSIEKIMTITYLWVYKAPYDFIAREVGISKATIVDWFNFCRDICRFTVESTECEKIGGPDSIVEIDESKFGKTKFH